MWIRNSWEDAVNSKLQELNRGDLENGYLNHWIVDYSNKQIYIEECRREQCKQISIIFCSLNRGKRKKWAILSLLLLLSLVFMYIGAIEMKYNELECLRMVIRAILKNHHDFIFYSYTS